MCLAEASSVFSGQDWTISGQRYRLLKCRACGCAFTDPQPDDPVLENLYRTSFDYRWYQDHYEAKLRDCRVRVKEYGPLLGGRVLDFGGGVGYFSRAAVEAELESVTFDPYVAADPPPKGSWDSVVALHALEHSNDLDRTVSRIKDFLVPGGRLILAVPNFAGLGYRELGVRWVWAQPPLVHIFHFTAAGLQALLARHGFGDLQVSFHERWDANSYCDVEHAEQFRKWDAAWVMRPFSSIPLYRKLIARRNSRRRFAGLEKALAAHGGPTDDYAELQVTGVLEGK